MLGNQSVKFYLKGVLLGVLITMIGCSSPSSSSDTEDDSAISSVPTEVSGGSSTVYDTTSEAFSHPSPILSSEERTMFFSGRSFFDQGWVAAPSSTEARDGLGPYFNARSCAACHFKDGRGAPPENGEPFQALLIRLSIAGQTDTGAPNPDPNYGGQLQGFSLQGVTPEAVAEVSYTELSGSFPDGETYFLAKPTYTIHSYGYGAMDPSIMMSPRVASAMIGMGLLEDISEDDVLVFSDESDSDGDGISGRPNYVWDSKNQIMALGRFGWKANQPSIFQQTAGAFLGDIGITTSLFSEQNITEAEVEETADVIHGGDPELSDYLLDRVVLYSRNLAVPARRNIEDPTVMRGENLFSTLNCVGCHRSSVTSRGETIHPYTDLLLHDMGEDLADNRPDFDATGQEWRTPPLWGIGLVETVNGHTKFLHDGRARNLKEAILWHGGEAEASREAFMNLEASDRGALIAFLESL